MLLTPRAALSSVVVASLAAAAPLSAQNADLLADCNPSSSDGSSQTSIKSDDGVKRWRVSWSNDRCSIDLRAEGRFELERDLSDVRTMERGGYLEIDVRRGSDRRSYEVTREGDALERRYVVNRQEQPIDAEARQWIAAMLLEVERRTGFAAPTRVSDLLQQGGPDAVMEEVRRMTSDYVQRRYLSVMLDSARLNEGHVRNALALSAEELSSDYEHASFLTDLGKRGYVTTAVASEFVTSTAKINSDYERRRALGAVLSLPDLPAATVAELMRAAGSFRSDYERAELLIGTAKSNGFPSGEARTAYLEAASTIRSDYEKGRVLKRLVSAELDDEQLFALLATAKTIRSDYELATLLVQVSDGRTLEGRARDAYLEATETIGSDYERRRALTALLGRRGASL